jgi:hypothetical protein
MGLLCTFAILGQHLLPLFPLNRFEHIVLGMLPCFILTFFLRYGVLLSYL